MEEWKEYKLGDVVISVKDRITTSVLNASSYISTENMLPNKAGVTLSSGVPSGNAIKFVADDILISNIRPYFKKIWQADRIGGCSSDVICLRANNITEPIYLYYLLSQDRFFDYVMQGTKGTKMPRGDRSQIMQWPVLLPSKNKQKIIAFILKSLDDKIEVNRKTNENLEQEAQALFKSWFVDFEPFKNGEFVESELGMIPKGWRVEKIGNLPINVTDYVANGSFASLKENVKLYQTPEYAYFIRNTDLKSGNYEVYVDKHSYEFLSKSTLYGGEVIISNVGDVGSVHLCPYLDKPMTLGNNIIMLKPDKQYYSFFLYILFKWAYGNDLIMSIKGGSAQPKFNKTDFKSLKIIVPNDVVLEKYHSIISSLFNKIRVLEDESRRLAELRDTLLPKLMSGELIVNEIDDIL